MGRMRVKRVVLPPPPPPPPEGAVAAALKLATLPASDGLDEKLAEIRRHFNQEFGGAEGAQLTHDAIQEFICRALGSETNTLTNNDAHWLGQSTIWLRQSFEVLSGVADSNT